MTNYPRNRRILPPIFSKPGKEEKRMYSDPVTESLNRSRNNLNKVNKNVADCMRETAKEVAQTWTNNPPPKQGPIVEPLTPPPESREHQEVQSDYEYLTPYGRQDQDNYHAVCLDVSDKICFLGGESKEDLEKKINSDDNIKDVLAVYGGNLLYYHEKRYLHIT